MPPIERRPLREEVRDELVRRLVDGSLVAGTDLKEAELADELGVSRTPLREALVTLEEDGFIEGRPGRGWWVPPLSAATIEEVYPIIAALEILALRTCDPTELASVVGDLRKINAQMAKVAADPMRAQQLDDRWHATLLGSCGNARLLELIANHKLIVHRFEYTYMSADSSVATSVDQHEHVASAIEDGRFEDAEGFLDENWKHGMQLLASWLRRAE